MQDAISDRKSAPAYILAAFDRIYRLPKTFTPLPLSFGSAYHRVMEWAGLSRMSGEIPEFRFDVVVKNKTPVFEQHITQRTQGDFLRLVELAKLAESMIAAEHFAPSEQGFYCGGCPHQTTCKVWHIERCRVTVQMAA